MATRLSYKPGKSVLIRRVVRQKESKLGLETCTCVCVCVCEACSIWDDDCNLADKGWWQTVVLCEPLSGAQYLRVCSIDICGRCSTEHEADSFSSWRFCRPKRQLTICVSRLCPDGFTGNLQFCFAQLHKIGTRPAWGLAAGYFPAIRRWPRSSYFLH